MGRPVLANPLWDDAPEPPKRRRGRPRKVQPPEVDGDDVVLVPKRRGRPKKDETAGIRLQEIKRFVHMWICPVGHRRHPYKPPTETSPVFCDSCSTQMIRHYWAER